MCRWQCDKGIECAHHFTPPTSMRRLTANAIKANTQEEILEVAEEITRGAKDRLIMRNSYTGQSLLSTLIMVGEGTVITSFLSHRQRVISDPISIAQMILLPLQCRKKSKYSESTRFANFAFCTVFNTLTSMEKWLIRLGIPSNVATGTILIGFSTLQTGLIRGAPESFEDFWDLLASAIVIAGSHLLTSLFDSLVSRYFGHHLAAIFTLPLEIYLADRIHPIAQFGIRRILKSLPVKSAPTLERVMPKNLDITPPDILTCPVCRDFLQDATEWSGFFFCQSCIDQMKSYHLLHPFLREPYRDHDVHKAPLLNYLTTKYINNLSDNR